MTAPQRMILLFARRRALAHRPTAKLMNVLCLVSEWECVRECAGAHHCQRLIWKFMHNYADIIIVCHFLRFSWRDRSFHRTFYRRTLPKCCSGSHTRETPESWTRRDNAVHCVVIRFGENWGEKSCVSDFVSHMRLPANATEVKNRTGQ